MIALAAMEQATLYRIIVPSGDLEASRAFYAQLLAHEGMRVSPGRHYFQCGGVTLAVYSPAGDGDPQKPRPNFGHVYFAVEALDEYFARAKALDCLQAQTGDGNLPMGEIAQRPWGERSFYADDPFGNPLCFVDSATLFRGD